VLVPPLFSELLRPRSRDGFSKTLRANNPHLPNKAWVHWLFGILFAIAVSMAITPSSAIANLANASEVVTTVAPAADRSSPASPVRSMLPAQSATRQNQSNLRASPLITIAPKPGKSVAAKSIPNVAKIPKASSLVKAPGSATKSKIPGKIETSWSVSRVLSGWDIFSPTDWPVSGEAVTAVAKGKNLDVHRGPGSDQPGLRFTEGRSFSGKVTLLVTRRYLDWIQVAIPVRPNGTVGWVRFDDVNVLSVPFRVVVDKSTNTMTIEQNGSEVFRRSVAIGTGDTPTPTGLFFIREIIRTDTNGPYGPYVLGLSGYSDVLQTFADGEGAIGIHGTNQPGLIGTNASFGCVRVTNDVMEAIVRMLPLGTPVEITNSIASLPTQRRSYAIPDVVYEVLPDATEVQTEDPVSIFDAPNYNAAGIDFNDLDSKSKTLTTTGTQLPTVPPA
jgi:L,D-transpeptidase catalytic domain